MTNSCEIHGSHSPLNLTTESHHVVPRAWQALWRPDVDKRVIWAPRTIELCPTGHRNTHEILVSLMKTWRDLTDAASELSRLLRAESIIRRQYGVRKEITVATDAARQWIAFGGSLALLVEAKQYGYGLTHIPAPPFPPHSGQ